MSYRDLRYLNLGETFDDIPADQYQLVDGHELGMRESFLARELSYLNLNHAKLLDLEPNELVRKESARRGKCHRRNHLHQEVIGVLGARSHQIARLELRGDRKCW